MVKRPRSTGTNASGTGVQKTNGLSGEPSLPSSPLSPRPGSKALLPVRSATDDGGGSTLPAVLSAPPAPSPTPLSRQPLASRRMVIQPKREALTTNSVPVSHAKPSKTLSGPQVESAGITPRSARRVRNSLRMTPLSPEGYVPLKPPATSPMSAHHFAKEYNQRRQVPVAKIHLQTPKSMGIQGGEAASGDDSFEWEIPSRLLTPLTDDAFSRAESPWHVVNQSASSSRRSSASRREIQNGSDWVLSSQAPR